MIDLNSIKMCGPSITDHEKYIVSKMMDDGWDSYQYVEEFERRFAEWHSRKYCLMTPCCTHAIHLGLLGLSIGKDDEVIVPECTWTGSTAPVTYVGAKPVFVDVSKDNWCVDTKSIQNAITTKTKAIIAVDIYGNMPNYVELQEICDKHNITLIEDAAEALGSSLNKIKAGKFGKFSVHSFHRTKTITTGEGGALLTDDEELYKRCKFLRDHGRSESIAYLILEATPKYMPSNLMGALACAQLDRIDDLVATKKSIASQYSQNLRASGLNIVITEDKDTLQNGCWATTVVIGEEYFDSEKLISDLWNESIPIRPFFRPLSSMPAYKKYRGEESKPIISEYLYQKGITLPSHYDLDKEHIDFISEKILSAINQQKKNHRSVSLKK